MTVLEATTVALEAAGLTVSEGPDAGVVAVLLRLADTIDHLDDDVEAPGGDEGGRKRPKPFDNVTIPTYLKYAEALGLTVAARARAADSKGGGQGGGGGLAAVLTLAGQATG